jgi:hypothetical protein
MKEIRVPHGWTLITESLLDDFREESFTTDEALAYFDGLSPTWKEVLSERIPQRKVVGEIQNSLEEARRVKRRQVTMVMGAGGEGKSTIIRQAVRNLLKAGSFDNILWHEEVNSPLEKTFIADLISVRETWLIVSDEAERIGHEVFEAVKLLREKAKTNVQFLLCCRDTDWKGVGADELSWNELIHVATHKIRGLNLEDSNLIVEAWGYYGDEGLGKLAGLDQFDAASRLVEQAKSEAQNFAFEGSFLGAMLRVRLGEAIQDHVKSLLRRLQRLEMPDSRMDLMEAFAYVIALHAENILLLTRSVLARSIDCEQEQLQRRVLGPLGEEAAISAHVAYVLTRHRAIAEVAKDILERVFDFNFEGIYKKLLRASIAAFHDGELEVNPAYWNQLPRTFFKRGQEKLGIQLARTLVEVEKENAVQTVSLAKLYREAREPKNAVKAFRDSFANVVNPDRVYYHEWSTSEGYNDDHFTSVWLDAIALDDETYENKNDKTYVPLTFAGLTTSFGKLFERTNDRRFIEACGAAAQLGLRSRPDNRSESNLRSGKNKSSNAGVGEVDPGEALERLIKGIQLASELRPLDESFPSSVKPTEELTFKGLSRWLGIQERGSA